ncbi:MAG TPA: transferrin receptor-like dimerization domain-containing protein [Opitutus sp.]|nr:transferrin receptor-like dimerization domain-containing protein [Opitutus sp.]
MRTLLVSAMAGSLAVVAEAGMLGFNERGAAEQATLEARFDAQLRADDQRAWLEQMTAAPNHLGSPHDKANAEFMLEQFRAWGWDAHIETFQVLFPTPKKVAVELVAPTRFKAKLEEPPVAGDRTSDQIAAMLPPYNAYGGDGDVTGDLVYANQGMPDDYKELARRGVDVRGKIVIARYGGGWRGLKPKLAQEHGAIGCIIYSDPRDDGYGAGEVYPRGGWRPADGVQRGSVMDMPIYPGDPLTPGVGATADAKRLTRAEAKTILKIPVLPISYADAQPLLAALAGPVAPEGWRGGLPITYHVGPGPAQVRVAVECDWKLVPCYDVIAVLRGSERPDEWVIRGNHHDGWVFGAWDPLSANVALMAEVKAIGALAQAGWRPKRTIVYASWDGEEEGLLGSTEWCEEHAAELQRKAVLYVNSDSNGRGFLRASGSHGFQALVNEVGAAVRDPQTGVTAGERVRAKELVDAAAGGASAGAKRVAKEIEAGGPVPIEALGSGSDYTAFIDHLGIASLDVRFGGEDDDPGIYHSSYDSFDHYARFGDPGFVYGVALAQAIGRVVLRTADADVVPVRLADFADTVGRYAGELHQLADGMREATETRHRLLDAGAFKLANDPVEKLGPPEREADVPVLNLAPLDNAVRRLSKCAKAGDVVLAQVAGGGIVLDPTRREELNALVRGLEQTLTSAEGLPGRAWFKHMIYAPGLETGYGVKTLPGVREAIEGRRWSEAEKYAAIVAAALDRYAESAEKIAAMK